MKYLSFASILLFSLFATVSFGQSKSSMDHAKGMMKDKVQVIQLSQTDGKYQTTSLELAPGQYIFGVTNQDVDKGLGFLLTPKSDSKAQVANSGLEQLVGSGETSRSGVVTLEAGEYQYTCPLNPTPQYSLVVTK